MKRHSVRSAGRFQRLVRQSWCIYCGARATTIDHFVPVSVVASVLSLGWDINQGSRYLVPSCGECNVLAGDNIFRSIGAKRRYIHTKIKHKYRRILALPPWSEDEIAELGYSLATAVRSGIAQKAYIEARLAWRNSQNIEPAKLAAVRLRYELLGRGFAPGRATARRSGVGELPS